MPLPTTTQQREYKTYVQNGADETCVRILGEVSIISGGGSGTKWNESYTGTTVVGSETTGITFTVGVGATRQLSQLNISCFRMCLIKVKQGSNLIMSGRTGPGSYNVSLQLSNLDSILTGEIITVTFEGFERASDIELYLSGTETT
jgi:hypothetical protein